MAFKTTPGIPVDLATLDAVLLDFFADVLLASEPSRDRDQFPTVFSRIAQEVVIILSPVMLVEQDLSIFPLHN